MSFKPDFTPQLSVYLTVTDANKSIKFYEEAFGFKTLDVAKDEQGNPQHVEMKKGDAFIMFCPEGAFGMPKKAPVTLGITVPLSMYVYCEDTDALYKKAIATSAKSIMEPHDSFWGDRFCSVADPDGYEWGFATFKGDK
jgi:uncharacterized glyoxalase superfamily protein PhnB